MFNRIITSISLVLWANILVADHDKFSSISLQEGMRLKYSITSGAGTVVHYEPTFGNLSRFETLIPANIVLDSVKTHDINELYYLSETYDTGLKLHKGLPGLEYIKNETHQEVTGVLPLSGNTSMRLGVASSNQHTSAPRVGFVYQYATTANKLYKVQVDAGEIHSRLQMSGAQFLQGEKGQLIWQLRFGTERPDQGVELGGRWFLETLPFSIVTTISRTSQRSEVSLGLEKYTELGQSVLGTRHSFGHNGLQYYFGHSFQLSTAGKSSVHASRNVPSVIRIPSFALLRRMAIHKAWRQWFLVN